MSGASPRIAAVPSPAVVLIARDSAPLHHDWTRAGIRLEVTPPNGRSLRRCLVATAPAWCIVDAAVEDSEMREVALEIRRTGDHARILVLGEETDLARCERWIRQGVRAYLAKSSPVLRIVEAMRFADVEDVVVVDACFQRHGLELVHRFQPDHALTGRELEVLQLASLGLCTEEIAHSLHLTAHTVNFHFGNLTAKLGTHGRTQAVARALLLGLIAGEQADASKTR